MIKNLQTQSFMRNPAPVLAELRQQGPLVRDRIPVLGKVWLTTTQAAANQVLKDSRTFTVRRKNGRVAGLQWWMPKSIQRLANNMLTTDEPDHSRLRGLVDQAFHRREVLSLEQSVHALAGDLSASLLQSTQPVDLLTRFARPLPLAVICELLGLPKEDRQNFSNWASGITEVKGIFSFLMALNSLKPLTRYLDGKIEEAHHKDGEGLIHELVHIRSKEGNLSRDELISMVFLLLIAGHETTTHLISGGVLALLQNPEQLETLKNDWSHLDLAVEELLRFVTPVQSTKPRIAQSDCEVSGVPVKAGDVVLPLLAAANFDPEVFEHPDKLDITRKPNRHIQFGTGIHFCLGHQLARLEMKTALKTLFSDYPELVLAIPEEELEWHPRFGIRSLKALPVRL